MVQGVQKECETRPLEDRVVQLQFLVVYADQIQCVIRSHSHCVRQCQIKQEPDTHLICWSAFVVIVVTIGWLVVLPFRFQTFVLSSLLGRVVFSFCFQSRVFPSLLGSLFCSTLEDCYVGHENDYVHRAGDEKKKEEDCF